MNESKKKTIKIFISLLLVVFTGSLSAQLSDSLSYENYYPGFPFQEGIYLSFEEFQLNNPSIQTEIEKDASNLYAWNDSLERMILIDPNKIWGYSKVGNVYISSNDSYWRIINFGALSQFSAIAISIFRTIDSFGFPMEQETKNMRRLFLDFGNGEQYILSSENLMRYIESEPLLKERFKKMKRIKEKELVMVLRAYNQLKPIYFPIYD